MRIRLRELAVLAVVAALSGEVQAQPIQIVFADSAGNYTNNFTIPIVGGFVDIQVYMNDTGNASSFFSNQSQLANLLTNSLFGFGLRVHSSNVNVANVPAGSPPNANVTINPAFGFVTNGGTSTAGGDVTMIAGVNLPSTGVAATATGQNPPNSSRVLLATLRYFATGQGTTTLSLADPDLANQNTALGNFASPGTNGGAILDPNPGSPITGLFSTTATISVPVPEPSSLLLLGVVAFGFRRCVNGRNRRQKMLD